MSDMDLKFLSGRNSSFYPCDCCGMTYKVPTKPLATLRSAGKGIRVIAGEHGQERTTDTLHIKHVQTKNGVLTILNKVK